MEKENKNGLLLESKKLEDTITKYKKLRKNNKSVSKNRSRKTITMRGNLYKDMEERLTKKYPQYKVVDKGTVEDNFMAGGKKYYQHFLVEKK